MEVHLKEMKEIAEKFASIGAPISKEDQVVILLGSLSPSYSTFVTALETCVDDIRLDFVQQALVNEEQKRNGQGSEGFPPNQRDAPLVGASTRERPWTPPVCWKCDEVGHIQCYCPKDRNSRAQHKAKAAEEHSNESASGEGVFVTYLEWTDGWLTLEPCITWCYKECLVNYHKFYAPEKVRLGDERIVETEGVGNVHLNVLFKVSNFKWAVMYDVLYVSKLACNLFSMSAAAHKGNKIKFG